MWSLFVRFVMACALLPASAWAADTIESIPVRFAKGASSATLTGTLKGDRIVDYRLRARAGQTLSVRLETGHTANYFNVLPPGSRDEAIFIGSTQGTEWTGQLASDGEYTVRVYLMRSAARRNETARYALTVGITVSGQSAASLGRAPASDARVAGTPYHATGQLPCSMGAAPAASAQCDFGVIRGAPGNAEVHVTPSGGFRRVLRFVGGTVSADGDAPRVQTGREDDAWLIDVNDYEHYRIPDAVISGG
ncbi:hypothetical protein [Methyloversatilis sp. NSM2]|uniref:hypothetical protein n=1 Tax=Methyloversatilis sp. NSM2 TaxID=3134135 RepID=UPI003110A1C5